MLIEQLYWKTVWNRAAHIVDSSIHHQQPGITEQTAFEQRLAKLAHAQFVTYRCQPLAR